MHLKNAAQFILGIVFVSLVLSTQLYVQPAMAETPELPKNSCAECHRKLLFSSETQRQFIDIRIKHLESGITCSIVCHEDRLNKAKGSTYAMWSVSTHALFNVTCEKCHGGDPTIDEKEISHRGLSTGEDSTILRTNTPETCGKCHEPELDEFKNSQHYKILEFGENEIAPACITCHQAHSVRVLTSSEIEDFCSNCHNRITNIAPDVPEKAESALASINELEVEISKTRSAIISARAKGNDVSMAEVDLEDARSILKHVPSVWHRFNLTYFETEVHDGISKAKKAGKETEGKPVETTPASTPGFEGILLVTGLFTAYFLRRH